MDVEYLQGFVLVRIAAFFFRLLGQLCFSCAFLGQKKQRCVWWNGSSKWNLHLQPSQPHCPPRG